MAQFRFVVDGDFVDFYDGAMHAFRVRNTTRDVDWYYETAPGIEFEVDGHRYNTVPSQIEIDGVTLSANEDFDDAIIGIFPNLAGGGGPGGTPGIDDVLAEEQMVVSRFIELQPDGLFEIVIGSTRDLLELDTTVDAEHSLLQATNITGLGSAAFLKAETQNGAGQFTFEANYNGEAVQAQINGSSSAGGSAIEYTADSHTFNGGGVWELGGNDLYINNGSINWLKLQTTPTTERALLAALGSEIPGATADLELSVGSDVGYQFDLRSNNGTNTVNIRGDSDDNKIYHNAVIHELSTGDLVIAALAGGGTTGLSIDNDGKIIRTP